MKALSLWQPWASLVACGRKKVETRSWSTTYRGPVLICSTASVPAKPFYAAINDPKVYERAKCMERGYVHGVALAVVDLVDVVPAEAWIARELELGQDFAVEREKALGDISPGRFAWRLGAVRLLPSTIPVKGRQGLWTPSAELVAQVNASLATVPT